jgi:hypothetical protein
MTPVGATSAALKRPRGRFSGRIGFADLKFDQDIPTPNSSYSIDERATLRH